MITHNYLGNSSKLVIKLKHHVSFLKLSDRLTNRLMLLYYDFVKLASEIDKKITQMVNQILEIP